MRQELVDYIGTLNLGTFTLSTELPWDASGVALYVKNPKKIYIDLAQSGNNNFITTFDGLIINNETTSVRVYFSADAKALPPNYEEAVTDLKTSKDITTISGVNRREVTVSTSFEDDLLVTELEFTFTKITN